jgi:hypothetical protein
MTGFVIIASAIRTFLSPLPQSPIKQVHETKYETSIGFTGLSKNRMPIALNFYSLCVYLLWAEQKMKEILLCFYCHGLFCDENHWNTIWALVL